MVIKISCVIMLLVFCFTYLIIFAEQPKKYQY